MTPLPEPNQPQPQPQSPQASRPVIGVGGTPTPLPTTLVSSIADASNIWWKALLAVAAVAVAAVGWQLLSSSGTESNHPNWQQVREASARPANEVRWQVADNTVMFLGSIPFGDADRDEATTAAVKAALISGDDAKAEQLIAAAQANAPAPLALLPTPTPTPTPAPASTPPPTPTPAPTPTLKPVVQPILTPGFKAEIRRGDTEFFHLYLYDSCDEDGDIVDIILNGQLFQQVRLSNRGVTLSIPVSSTGATKIELRGVYDGGGGITVGCRTSRGHGFLRAMSVGETQLLGTIRK